MSQNKLSFLLNLFFFLTLAKLQFTLQLNTIKQQAKEHEYRANTYFQKFAKLQGDYHNLIGISAELVDSLEKCVRGEMVSDYRLLNEKVIMPLEP